MRTMPAWFAVWVVACTGGMIGAAELTPGVVSLPCIPVAAYWTGPPQSAGMPLGPALAVVSTKIRPKDAHLVLDGHFIGRARFFDGKPGYLYLEPGKYQLELTLGGYRTEIFEIDAQAACRFEIRHRMIRDKGTPKERSSDPPGKGRPLERTFRPKVSGEPANPRAAVKLGCADPSVRSDIDSGEGAVGADEEPAGASLRLVVLPETASVSIDGRFVATGEELARMEAPLAVPSGSRRIEVRAAGYRPHEQLVAFEAGQTRELVVTLQPSREGDASRL
ncbi:MAG: hypothetical protein ACC742_08140 [Thermoanaerobaculales bacterium]